MPNTSAYQGRGSHLASSPDGVSYTNIAQLQKFAFGGMKSALEDITNLDSPTVFKEWLPTIVDATDVAYNGILDPQNPTTINLTVLLQNRALTYFKITLVQGTTITFQGYVTDHMPVSVEYAKALTFSGKITISGGVVITP